MGVHLESRLDPSALILYLGFTLSESLAIPAITPYFSGHNIQHFFIFFSCVMQLLLITLLVAYVVTGRRGLLMQISQYIVYPLQVLLTHIVLSRDHSVTLLLFALFSLLLQGGVIFTKITSISSNFQADFGLDFNAISIIIRIFRFIKLTIMAIFPIFQLSPYIFLFLFALLQFISLILFLFKFTYQKCFHEYLVALGLVVAAASLVDFALSIICDIPYSYIGELASLYLFLAPHTFLHLLLEMKYLRMAKKNVNLKDDEEMLGVICFINQVLFRSKLSVRWSIQGKTCLFQSLLSMISCLNKSKKRRLVTAMNQCILDQLLETHLDEIVHDLNQVIEDKLRPSNCFPCFEYCIQRLLQLGDNQRWKALIIFYTMMGQAKTMGCLQRVKFECLYNQIRRNLPVEESDRHSSFVEFNSKLDVLAEEISEFCRSEQKFILYVRKQKEDELAVPEEQLLSRHEQKNTIVGQIISCLKQQLYVGSTHFKYIYLLFSLIVCKCHQSLYKEIMKLFHSVEIKHELGAYQETCIAIVSGSTGSQQLANTVSSALDDANTNVVGTSNGEIINVNEAFQSKFKIVINRMSRHSIGDLIPSESQVKKHTKLMLQSGSFDASSCFDHAQLTCYLMLQKDIYDMPMVCLEKSMVSTRIYYQQQDGFNYVCCISSTEQDDNVVRVARKQWEKLMRSNLAELGVKKILKQLGENFEVFEFPKNAVADQLQESQESSASEQEMVPNSIDKSRLIEQKIRNMQLSAGRVVVGLPQLLLIVLLIIAMLAQREVLQQRIAAFAVFIRSKEATVRQAEIQEKVYFTLRVIDEFINDKEFPRDSCSKYDIDDLQSFVEEQYNILLQRTRDLQLFLEARDINGMFSDKLLNQLFLPPSLVYLRPLTTYLKRISLLKSFIYDRVQFGFNYSSASLSFEKTILKHLLTSSIVSPNSLSLMLTSNARTVTNNFMILPILSRYIVHLLSLLLLLLILKLQYQNSSQLIELYTVLRKTPEGSLLKRSKEMRYTMHQLEKLKSLHIQQVEIEVDFKISIKKEHMKAEKKELFDLGNLNCSKAETNMSIGTAEEIYDEDQQAELLVNKDANNNLLKEGSPFTIFLSYRKFTVLIIVASLLASSALQSFMVDSEINRYNKVWLTDKANEDLAIVQQASISMLAYNWLQLMSQNNAFNISAADRLYSEAMSLLKSSTYRQALRNAYGNVSSEVLNGNICFLSLNQSTCSAYGQQVFASGLEMIIPLIIKKDAIASNPRQDNGLTVGNTCEQTWIYFTVVSSVFSSLPGYFQSLQPAGSPTIEVNYLSLRITILLLLMFFIVCSNLRQQRVLKRCKLQLLSLDTVQQLYNNHLLQPYFNRIYYE